MGWRKLLGIGLFSCVVAAAVPPEPRPTPVQPVAPIAGACVQQPFGVAEGFNLFVLGNLDHRNTDTEGRVAVGGNARFHHYSLGAKAQTVPGGRPAWSLIVGRDLMFTEGTIWGGPVACGGQCHIGYTATAHHGTYRANPIDFTAAQTYLWNLSRGLAKYAVKGGVTIDGKAITLTGEERGVNTFSLTADQLVAATYLAVRVPEGATVVVNVAGQCPALRHFGFGLSGVTRNRILYNFFEATELTLQHVGIEGTILAPFAAVTFNDGVIHGRLVVQALAGSGQVNDDAPFAGCLAEIPGCRRPGCK